MINYKTKSEGMEYIYGGEKYYIEHGYFKVLDYSISDFDAKGSRSISMTISDINNNIYSISPYYDIQIDLNIGDIVKIAYIIVRGDIRAHGYELVTDESLINSFNSKYQERHDINQNRLNDSIKDLSIKLREYIDEITYLPLCNMLLQIYEDYSDKILHWPAAVSVHHNFESGLAVHLLNVTRVADALSNLYTNVDKNIVLAGALLHDIGKVEEYTQDGKISDVGMYQDHISLGQIIISKYKDFIDDKTYRQLEHIILSHHGKLEWGSPKVPQTKEAFIVHQADYIDSQMYIYHEMYKKTSLGEMAFCKYTGGNVINEAIDVKADYSN